MLKDFKKMIAINLAVIFFVALDRFFKIFAFANQAGEVNILGEILKFNYKANFYIAFSLPISGVWLNAAIGLIILLLIYFFVRMWLIGRRDLSACLFAVIVGAASNLFDRLKYGFVIDYLDLKYFAVFNLADAMIVAGVVLLLISIYKKEAV